MLRQLFNDESGMIISAELVLVLTICVLGVIVGLSHVVMAVNEELSDVAQAIGSLDQSYTYTGYTCCKKNGVATSATPGSYFIDKPDDCDCSTSCDLIVTPNMYGIKSDG
jgi:Flp pilus assembly pilin Flp